MSLKVIERQRGCAYLQLTRFVAGPGTPAAGSPAAETPSDELTE